MYKIPDMLFIAFLIFTTNCGHERGESVANGF